MSAKTSLTLSNLLSSSPIHSGLVLKLSSSPVYTAVPSPIQYILSFFPKLLPRWTDRHLVAIGKYLYKFESDCSSLKSGASCSVKGSPIPLDRISARIVAIRDDSEEKGQEEQNGAPHEAPRQIFIQDYGTMYFPEGYNAILSISTFHKTQYYALPSREAAMTWIHSLSLGRSESIQRGLGHGGDKPVPDIWRHYDAIGKDLHASKLRVKERLERMYSRKGMEVGAMGMVDGMGPNPTSMGMMS